MVSSFLKTELKDLICTGHFAIGRVGGGAVEIKNLGWNSESFAL